MAYIANYAYNKTGLKQIAEWPYGNNWPVVYIIYNETKAYVGESLDAVRRTEQHLKESAFSDFTRICLISNRTYNKSVILDLEAFLIKYMGADGTKKLTNVNPGITNHNYFYKEAYVDEFKEIWSALIKKGIVKSSIVDIENSPLFKFSPYKSLNNEQQNATYEILKTIYQVNKATTKSLITVAGGAGTGKTILAVYLIKLLVDIIHNKQVWTSIDNPDDALLLESISKKLSGIKKIGFVVPMRELRDTMKTIFDSIDGLSKSMILSPEEVVEDYYDVLVVDEAHRLYRRKHLPQNTVNSFDMINKRLMGEKFSKSINDLTELDWIIRSSRIQVLFYDEYQVIRATDIGHERFEEICRPHLCKYIELFSQMRCKGGNGYYEHIKDVLEKTGLDIRDYKAIQNYEVRSFDSVDDLFKAIKSKNNKNSICKIVTGPGWSSQEDIVIEGKNYQWAKGKKDSSENIIFSIHKTQGFDLNYAGVIFGKEIYYDEQKKRIEINKKELKDARTKENGDDYMRRYILNIYLTLMTRGIDGTFVYAMDKPLREYLKKVLG